MGQDHEGIDLGERGIALSPTLPPRAEVPPLPARRVHWGGETYFDPHGQKLAVANQEAIIRGFQERIEWLESYAPDKIWDRIIGEENTRATGIQKVYALVQAQQKTIAVLEQKYEAGQARMEDLEQVVIGLREAVQHPPTGSNGPNFESMVNQLKLDQQTLHARVVELTEGLGQLSHQFTTGQAKWNEEVKALHALLQTQQATIEALEQRNVATQTNVANLERFVAHQSTLLAKAVDNIAQLSSLYVVFQRGQNGLGGEVHPNPPLVLPAPLC